MPTCHPLNRRLPLLALLALTLSLPAQAFGTPTLLTPPPRDATDTTLKCHEGQCTDDFPALETVELILEILELGIRQGGEHNLKGALLGLLGLEPTPSP